MLDQDQIYDATDLVLVANEPDERHHTSALAVVQAMLASGRVWKIQHPPNTPIPEPRIVSAVPWRPSGVIGARRSTETRYPPSGDGAAGPTNL